MSTRCAAHSGDGDRSIWLHKYPQQVSSVSGRKRPQPVIHRHSSNSMQSAISVNAALDELATLSGQDIAVVGILRFEFERTALDHFPKAERRTENDDGPLEPSSVWLSVGSGALQFNKEQLLRWHGKRVTVLGTLLRPNEQLGGCGHFSAWPAEVLARSIERL
ncbi:hypothetical protein AVME950_00445 [Acidovorax sp. SUPP950]|uniref:hypothetical protein n=1 Tax=Acidovorax sp. SUPP950 TaxID=511901 RepID=UPI0023CC8E54|nr:hypothetical protein [Acidovorax sp. SUPP950]GKS73307.1 hypothetical protein AVME950_00445 [Acidovorax sp. SUPP950]